MQIKEALMQVNNDSFIEETVKITKLPESMDSTRALRRRAQKQLKIKYKKLIKKILKLEPIETGNILFFDKEQLEFICNETEYDVKGGDWKEILGSEIEIAEDDLKETMVYMFRYMTWYFESYAECKKGVDQIKEDVTNQKSIKYLARKEAKLNETE